MVYDGFISYSHAADDLLAPRLQAGLQRFAKPWWKRRALRIFRDESSLSANPHLWSSITDALDQSDWFVLLLSPDAAESEWVNQEVEYWLEHREAGRIIPVVTDGEFTWSETDIDLESTAVPPALYGAFSDEPRWVDLRFARSEEHLDLNNPRFSAAVADIASAIRGVPKDELESEEVHQHRRTVRTAWAAVAGLLVLALLAGGASLFAIDRANEAEAQAEIAQARELTLAAEQTLESDPELSMHLALTALAKHRDPQTVAALRAAIANDRVLVRIPGGGFVGVDANATLLATSDVEVEGGVAVWDLANGQIIGRYAREGALARDAALSPDGNLLAVSFDVSVPAVTVWDRTTGDSFDIDAGGGDNAGDLTFSPDGAFLAFNSTTGLGVVPVIEEWSTEVWSMDDRRLVYQGVGWGPDISGNGLLSYVQPPVEGAGSVLVVVDPVSGATVHSIPSDIPLGWTVWSPDDTRIAATTLPSAGDMSIVVFDVEQRSEIARLPVVWDVRPEWLGDGAILVGGESATTVLSVDTGDVLFALTERGGTGEIEVLPGTTRVAIADAQVTETVIFDTSQLGGVEVGGWLAPLGIWRASYVGDGTNVVLGANLGEPTDQLTFITADADDGIEIQSVLGNDPFWWPDMTANGAYVPSPDSEGNWAVYSTVTGDPIYAAPEGWLIKGASWDGTKAVVHHFDSESTQCGPTRLVATVDGSVVATLADNECTGRATFAPSGEVVFLGFLPLGKPLHSGLFDANSGELLAELGDTPCVGLVAEFTPDSTELITGLGSLCVLDVEALKAGVSVDEAIDRHIPGHAGLVLRIAVSPDASEAATAALGEPVRWWDLHTGELLGEFGGSPEVGMHDADFHPSLPHLLVTTPLNEVRVHTLDIDELISIAESRLSRDMTEQECQQYFRTACDDA